MGLAIKLPLQLPKRAAPPDPGPAPDLGTFKSNLRFLQDAVLPPGWRLTAVQVGRADTASGCRAGLGRRVLRAEPAASPRTRCQVTAALHRSGTRTGTGSGSWRRWRRRRAAPSRCSTTGRPRWQPPHSPRCVLGRPLPPAAACNLACSACSPSPPSASPAPCNKSTLLTPVNIEAEALHSLCAAPAPHQARHLRGGEAGGRGGLGPRGGLGRAAAAVLCVHWCHHAGAPLCCSLARPPAFLLWGLVVGSYYPRGAASAAGGGTSRP